MSTPNLTPRAVVEAHYAAGARGDLAAMIADLDPHVQWTEAAGFPCAGTHVGPQAVVANVFEAIAGEWDGFGFHPDQLLEAGDTVVALGSYRGRHRKSGQTLDVRTAHVWQVAAGRITGFEQFTDTLIVARAMTGEQE